MSEVTNRKCPRVEDSKNSSHHKVMLTYTTYLEQTSWKAKLRQLGYRACCTHAHTRVHTHTKDSYSSENHEVLENEVEEDRVCLTLV